MKYAFTSGCITIWVTCDCATSRDGKALGEIQICSYRSYNGDNNGGSLGTIDCGA